MAAGKDGALLAHISDTVTEVAEVLEEQKDTQRNVLAVLNQLLEASQAQTEMLAAILDAASQEAGPSPVAQALEALTAVVERLADNQASLIMHVTELPEAIGRQFEASLKERAEAS